MSSVFHPGECAVQDRAGVRGLADRVSGSIRDRMPEVARRFLETARLVVVAAMDAEGRPWASIVTGEAGVIRPFDDRTVVLSRDVAETDPLAGALVPGAIVGLLVPDLAARRRMRINGRVAAGEAGTIVIRAEQVYANCPKYIQPREAGAEARLSGGAAVTRGRSLSARQRELIRRADTFFIATANPGEGLDASHRGGPPGFVQVAGDTLGWPDYAGNAMFNTLGNIALYPRAGIVVPDFQTGTLLQVTGTAAIEWTGDPGPGAGEDGRSVRLSIDAVVESARVRDPI